VSIHDIDVEAIRPGLLGLGQLLAQFSKVS
jgi:hypothetical protein